jgi:site-specific recombinase XerD
MSELEPLEPERGVELYLKHRADDCADSTLNAHRLRLKHLLRWCEERDITNLNELTGRRLHEYRLWRKAEGDLNRVSVRTQMSTLRAFLDFCAQIDAVEMGLKETVDVPELDKGENARSVHIDNDHAEKILSQLAKYEYASLRHVLILLLWKTGVRTGTVRSINIDDVDSGDGYIEIRHRPDYGTPLKNKSSGERFIAISNETGEILTDWIEEKHPGTEDEHGQTPLLATNYGRISRSNIRKNSYWVTRPQFIGDECECEVEDHSYDKVHECEDAVSPHALRRGSITHHLRSEVPRPVVSERANVSGDVLEKHYDQTSLEEQMNLRRDHLDNI